MPWPQITLRGRREQVRNDVAAHLPGADAAVPNAPLTAIAEAQASLTHDNDQHLDWVASMMMPDTAEDEFAERWANIWLEQGRKGASFAEGMITVSGISGSAVSSGAELTSPGVTLDGASVTLRFEVTAGVTLPGPSASVHVEALTAGALGNLPAGAQLAFTSPPGGVDGVALTASPGLAGGADSETDAALIARYIARIQEPPHGGGDFDYVAWMLEVPGVTRAWAAQEMGVGTVTCRFMMDDVRFAFNGIPQAGDLTLVAAYLAARRPVTVAQVFVVAPIAQPQNITITTLANDTPEVRANIMLEIAEMLKARAKPGALIYAAWYGEAISSASGEDHHTMSLANVVPSSAGHIIVPGVITYS